MKCSRCGREAKSLQYHHIIPVAIVKQMKYRFRHTVKNTIAVCEECHFRIHQVFEPDRYHWKQLCNKMLKMKDQHKIDRAIEETLELQYRKAYK